MIITSFLYDFFNKLTYTVFYRRVESVDNSGSTMCNPIGLINGLSQSSEGIPGSEER